MNKNKTTFIGFALLSALFFLSSNLYGQGQSRFATKGLFEIGGNIAFQSLTSVSNGETAENALNTFSRTLYFGYFVSDGFELGLNPLSWTTISQGDESISQFSILAAPSYNFKTGGMAFPFIEGLIGYSVVSNGTSRSGISWGGRGGVKLAFIEHANIVIGIQYVQTTLNVSGATERSGYNTLEGSIGFSIWL